jgi:hypothetical protein
MESHHRGFGALSGILVVPAEHSIGNSHSRVETSNLENGKAYFTC